MDFTKAARCTYFHACSSGGKYFEGEGWSFQNWTGHVVVTPRQLGQVRPNPCILVREVKES